MNKIDYSKGYLIIKVISALVTFVAVMIIKNAGREFLISDFALISAFPLLVSGILKFDTWKLSALLSMENIQEDWWLIRLLSLDFIVNICVAVLSFITFRMALSSGFIILHDLSNYGYYFLLPLFDTSGTIDGHLRWKGQYKFLISSAGAGLLIKIIFVLLLFLDPVILNCFLIVIFLSILVERVINILMFYSCYKPSKIFLIDLHFFSTIRSKIGVVFAVSTIKSLINRSDVYLMGYYFGGIVLSDYYIAKQLVRFLKILTEYIPKVYFPSLLRNSNDSRDSRFFGFYGLMSVLTAGFCLMVGLTYSNDGFGILVMNESILTFAILLSLSIYLGLLAIPIGVRLLKDKKYRFLLQMTVIQCLVYFLVPFLFYHHIYTIPLGLILGHLMWFIYYFSRAHRI